jgi:alpha-glucosidase
MRTPMPWRNAPGGGFTGPAVEPWLPFGDLAACNVEDQRDEPGSALRLVRDLIALRRETPALQSGPYRTLELEGAGGAHAWAWSRGDRIVVMAAMGADVAALEGCHGRVLIGTDRQRDGEAVEGELRVAGWEAVVVEREGSTATGQAPTGRGVSPD